MLQEFKEFIQRGNVIDLAVAVVLGAAFGAVTKSFTDDVLMQLLAALGGEPDFSGLTLTINDAEIRYGVFLTAVINFVIVGFAMFLVVKAINRMQALGTRKGEAAEEAPAPTEADLLVEIRDLLRQQA